MPLITTEIAAGSNEKIGEERIRFSLLNEILLLSLPALLLFTVKPPIDSRASKDMSEVDKLQMMLNGPLTDDNDGREILDLSQGKIVTDTAVVQSSATSKSASFDIEISVQAPASKL